MERIRAINASRIEWCCAERGITPEQLAAECRIALPTMQKVIESDGALTFGQLRTVADYFGRGVLFFLEESPVDPQQVHTPQFRTLANQKPELSPKIKTLIERVEHHRDFYVAQREYLDATDFPRFDPPNLAGRSVAAAARIAREWLGLGAANSFDTYRQAVEAKGVLVFRSNGYNGRWQIAKESPILGFSLYDAQCPVIVVKKLVWEPRQSFTLIHELGHILLHKISSIDDESDFRSHEGAEREANAFAGLVLVPDEFLRTIDDHGLPQEVALYDDWLEPQRRAWGVSAETILRRLLDAGWLPQARYAEYRTWRDNTATTVQDDFGSRAYRHREPRHIFGDIYVRTVLNSLYARNITLAKASTYLDSLKIKDLHQLARLYARP